MAKREISWKRKDDDGNKVQVYAHHVRKGWEFFIRGRRFETWEPHPTPPLEDWMELLDGVERRVSRRLLAPDDLARLKRTIKEQFPEAEI